MTSFTLQINGHGIEGSQVWTGSEWLPGSKSYSESYLVKATRSVPNDTVQSGTYGEVTK
jgi:hypothetical protein